MTDTPTSWRIRFEDPRAQIVGLLILTLLLVATCVPHLFTIDESNYLVTVTGLRHGRFTVPGTDGLTPSTELAFFDPVARTRALGRSPVGSAAPPLYAFLALPFSLFGWRGLVALNAVAFSVTTALVFWLARRHANEPRTPWIAAATFALGGYSLEYAQGMWPHMLSASLATAAFCLASRARETAALWPAASAGFVAGVATGVRYQNVVFAIGVGLGLLLFARRRFRASAAFALLYALPLLVCSVANQARLGSWNPISKGPGYLSRGLAPSESPNLVLESMRTFTVRVIDYSRHPPTRDVWREGDDFDAETGVWIYYGAIKKAWLQSAPWLALALAGAVVAWLPRRGTPGGAASDDLRSASLVLMAVLGVFAFFGLGRHDGASFNQRYFLELVPLSAVVAARMLEIRPLDTRALRWGADAGVLGALLLFFFGVQTVARQRLELTTPLLIAAALVASFSLPVWRRWPRALPFLYGAAVAWAAVVHVGEDVRASRSARDQKAQMQREVEGRLPDAPVALFAHKPWAEVLGPFLLKHDLVLVDPWVDDGATTEALVGDFLGKGRRVLFLAARMPKPLLQRLRERYDITVFDRSRPAFLLELTRRERPRPARSSP